MFQSGMRVFDIRDLLHPREIAYFNPGGTGQDAPPGSQDGSNPTTTGYPSARPRIIPERGELWFTDQNKGFFVTRFTNGVWPFQENAAAATPAGLGLPAPAPAGSRTATCLAKGSLSVRLPSRFRTQARSATLLVNGRAVKRVRGNALRRPIAVRAPAGHFVLRIVVQTRAGKRFVETREYTRCSASTCACGCRRSFTIRLPAGLRSARVLVDGKRVRVLPGRRLRARIDLRGRRSPTVHVKVTGVDRNGRTVITRRTYHPCAKHAKRG